MIHDSTAKGIDRGWFVRGKRETPALANETPRVKQDRPSNFPDRAIPAIRLDLNEPSASE